MVWVFRVVRPVATVRVRVEPDLEPTRHFGPVANTRGWLHDVALLIATKDAAYLYDRISKKYLYPSTGYTPWEIRISAWWLTDLDWTLVTHPSLTRSEIYRIMPILNAPTVSFHAVNSNDPTVTQ